MRGTSWDRGEPRCLFGLRVDPRSDLLAELELDSHSLKDLEYGTTSSNARKS